MKNNVNPEEVAKFDKLAANWWDANGAMKPLHLINPIRLNYIKQHATLDKQSVLDVGCGGGLLSEAMAKEGANTSGIDLSPAAIDVASKHALDHQLSIDYQLIAVETLAEQRPASFDIITCMEMLEHVPDPEHIIQACATLLKPNGKLFLSTINRNPKAFLMAIVGAEYLLQLLPKGTHHYAQFIRPSELDAWAQQATCRLRDLRGLSYSVTTKLFSLSDNVSVNYLAYYQKSKTDAQQ